MGQGVGEWSLNELHLGPLRQRDVLERAVERGQPFEEPAHLGIPVVAALSLPHVLALRESDPPGHQIGQVRDDLRGPSRRRPDLKRAEIGRRLSQHLGGAVRECGHEMTQHHARHSTTP